MTSKEENCGTSELRFSKAAEAFRGYGSPEEVPDELFAEISRIAARQKMKVKKARDWVALVIYQDQVVNKKRKLTESERNEIFRDIRARVEKEVHELEFEQLDGPSNVVRLRR
jgi:hypothetical protein